MNSYKTAVAIAIGTLFAGTALAQSNYEIEQRDRQQQARIQQGIQSGELTRHETRELMEDRARIEGMERRARADGVLSHNERNRIDNAQDRLGRNIYQETHDRQDRDRGWRGRDNGNNGWDRGHDRGNGWGRGNDHGRGHAFGRDNDHGRGHDFGRGNDHRQFGNRDGGRGEHNTTHAGNNNPRTGNGWTPRTDSTTPRTDSQPRTGQSDRSGGRQASMPQAQPRSTPSRETRTVTASRGDSGRRTR